AGSRLLPPLTAAWLVVLWLLLWGRVSPGLVASGLVVALVATAAFPLPEIPVEGRPRPLATLVFLLRLAWDVARASVGVAALAFRRSGEAPTAVIGVPLRTRSDLMLTLVGEVLSIVPGSIVVEIDRRGAVLYLHLIGVATREAVERERRSALATEARMIRAFGSPTDREALDRAEAAA
ncbi:Na+/H+ antiporter subunit E, partial [Patulibacter sp. S7RM1-6]